MLHGPFNKPLMGQTIIVGCWVTCLSRRHVGRIVIQLSLLYSAERKREEKMQMSVICIQSGVVIVVQLHEFAFFDHRFKSMC